MAAAIPFIASYVLSSYAQSQQADRQSNINNQMLAYNMPKSQAALDATNKYVSAIAPGQRTSDLADASAATTGRLNSGVADVQAFEAKNNFGGKVNSAYTTSRAAGAATNADRMKELISNLSVIGSPGAVALKNASTYDSSAANVGSNMGAINAVDPYYQAAMGTVKPTPWLSFLGQGVAGAGMANAAGAFKPKVAGAQQPGAPVVESSFS